MSNCQILPPVAKTTNLIRFFRQTHMDLVVHDKDHIHRKIKYKGVHLHLDHKCTTFLLNTRDSIPNNFKTKKTIGTGPRAC